MTAVPMAAMVPFFLMLAAIAVCPLWVPHFWDRNRNKLIVALLVSAPTLAFLFQARMGPLLVETMIFDYVPFIILLGALFVITGGIFFDGRLPASPFANTVLMALGALLASFLGTTGAAMLLIRPLLHMNRPREHKVHILLFFIAIICNSGGLLTPLGDPPLFMMYLRGVPFEWFFKLTPLWLVANSILLLLFVGVDVFFWRREKPDARAASRVSPITMEIRGKLNFIWLLGVLLVIAFVNGNTIPAIHTYRWIGFVRETLILALAGLSLFFTPHLTRVSNSFTWHPIAEVAYLFLGIFVTMIPCLVFLGAHAHSLHVTSATAFYYVTGGLSSILDNTPTAVTFYALAQGLGQQAPAMVAGIEESIMEAICAGAVLFGAMTYIGNGPNFMVKTIAERDGIRMPGFFGYIWKFSLPVLLPVFILVQLFFLR